MENQKVKNTAHFSFEGISRRALLKNLFIGALGVGCGFGALAQTSSVEPGLGKAEAIKNTNPIRLALIESLSGPFANTGEAVWRNLIWAIERVNQRGGVLLPASIGGARPLQLLRFDSKGQTQEALAALQAAKDAGAHYILQGNSSAIAEALLNAIEKSNQRNPDNKMLFLNYSAVDPDLTNEKCSFLHFRFDAHAQMRMNALISQLEKNHNIKRVYLFGQDYSFGHTVLSLARQQIAARRPDIEIVGETYHPIGRVKDFAPYVAKIKASKAQAIVTGNWGNDLTLFIKMAGEMGYQGDFYTFYGNALGAPAAIGDAGVGKVFAVADWFPNDLTPQSRQFYEAFHKRYPRPEDDYVHMRMQLLIEALAQAFTKSKSIDPQAVAFALEHADVQLYGQRGFMRAQDHQFQQPLMVGVMQKAGTPKVPFQVEGSGYGFEVIHKLTPEQAELGTTCKMVRPS